MTWCTTKCLIRSCSTPIVSRFIHLLLACEKNAYNEIRLRALLSRCDCPLHVMVNKRFWYTLKQ